MLLQLEINNVALIDKVCIELGSGLNVLTGETGAGKSIIIDSINAILGARIPKDLIRTGCEKALVQAVFQIDDDRLVGILNDVGIEAEEDNTLIISREFSLSGKNTCRINGKLVTVSVLREVGERIIDIHGQFDNQSLLRTENHIELLDSFGGEEIHQIKHEYSEKLAEYKTLKARLKELSGNERERERKIDLLKFQIDEIKKAKLKIGEEEELSRQKLLLANAEKIANALSCAYEMLFSGDGAKCSASDSLNSALSELNSIAKLDSKYADFAKRIEDISYQLEDIISELREERDNTEYNPQMLEQIEERLDLIYKLKRKYGSTVEEVLQYYEEIQRDLEGIIKSEDIANELIKNIKQLDEEMLVLAKGLHTKRQSAIKLLEDKIGEQLEDLDMKRARFKVNIEFNDELNNSGERDYTQNGLDKVEFLISPNVGEPLKPLSKIASGGEMSRIMLAIKTILADVDRMPTLIFDEIDIGVSGRAAQKIGEKLSYISRNHQVICVTHLAQIACMADNHFLIEKIVDGDTTKTKVDKLDSKNVEEEIARILGGTNITETTRRYAKEMLKTAREFKRVI